MYVRILSTINSRNMHSVLNCIVLFCKLFLKVGAENVLHRRLLPHLLLFIYGSCSIESTVHFSHYLVDK